MMEANSFVAADADDDTAGPEEDVDFEVAFENEKDELGIEGISKGIWGGLGILKKLSKENGDDEGADEPKPVKSANLPGDVGGYGLH